MEFIYFLGRFHVLMLHLPIGILTLAVVLEILVRFRPFRNLEIALAPTWIAGAISAVVHRRARLHARHRGAASRAPKRWRRTAGPASL